MKNSHQYYRVGGVIYQGDDRDDPLSPELVVHISLREAKAIFASDAFPEKKLSLLGDVFQDLRDAFVEYDEA